MAVPPNQDSKQVTSDDLAAQLRTQRLLGRVALTVGLGSMLCFAFGLFALFVIGLLVTTALLVLWVFSSPWINPFDPD